MMDFLDVLVFAGMVLLRFGVPLVVLLGVGYLLKRLDRRWEREAWEERRKAQEAETPAEQPSVPVSDKRPVAPVRTPAPGPVIPFIPPQVRETPRPQPGLAMPRVAQRCSDVKGCSETDRAKCPAPQNPQKPCWQARFDAEGHIPEDCVNCDIFQRYPMM